MCIGCRERRAADWELRIMHEAALYDSNCFVTLTYGRDKLPANQSLCYADFQSFMRRLRWHFKGKEVRFFMCGEYGTENKRPHYHACLFNVAFGDEVPMGRSKSGFLFSDSALLRDLWGHGHVSVQALVRETAGYCSRYIMTKALGKDAKKLLEFCDSETGEVLHRSPEFCRMSLKPGIGARWFDRFGRDLRSGDFVVSGGVQRRIPKYYDKLSERRDLAEFEDRKFGRVLKARALPVEEKSSERLAVQEKVHAARIANQTRSALYVQE
ncbi:replication associated protein [Microviridae sp.]|nr:replication associated protein [Microviridae sp.]